MKTNSAQSLPQTKRDEMLSNAFCKACISLMAKPDKNNKNKEKYRLVFFMNVDKDSLIKYYQKESRNM